MDFYIRIEVGDQSYYLLVTQDEFNAYIELVREKFQVNTFERPGDYDDGSYIRFIAKDDHSHYLGFIYKHGED